MTLLRRVLVGPVLVVLAIVGLIALGQRGASEVVVGAAALSAWVFIGLYHFLSRGAWRRDPIGRHVMAFVGVDAVVFTMLGAAMIWVWLGILPWYQWTYLVSVAGIPWTIIWRIVILVGLYRLPDPGGVLLPEGAPVPAVAGTSRRTPMKIKHPFLLWQSVLAGLQVVAGVSYLATIVGARSAAIIVILSGAAQAATALYTHGVTSASGSAPASNGGTS